MANPHEVALAKLCIGEYDRLVRAKVGYGDAMETCCTIYWKVISDTYKSTECADMHDQVVDTEASRAFTQFIDLHYYVLNDGLIKLFSEEILKYISTAALPMLKKWKDGKPCSTLQPSYQRDKVSQAFELIRQLAKERLSNDGIISNVKRLKLYQFVFYNSN
jgi:hypothetical protein